MNNFVVLSNDEIMSIDGGDFWESVGYASSAYGAYSLSSASLGLITASAPAIATAGLITGGLVFGVAAVVCGAGFLFSLFD